MSQKVGRVSPGKWIALIVAAFCMLATGFVPPPEGLSQSGFQVLGIMIGASILFLSWGTGWPSMATIFAFLTVPALNANQIFSATFGNGTLIFLMFTFMLAGCLIQSGVAKRVSVWFLTNKLARRSPWWTVAMLLIANFVISLFLSSATTFMIMFPIVEEMLRVCGVTKEKKAPIATALILGVLVTGLLSNGGNPIAHAMTLQGFSFYEGYAGQPMDFFTYCVICTPVTIVACILFFLLLRFVWRPDMSALTNIDYDALSAGLGQMSKKEKWSAVFYLLCVLFWLLPGLTQYIWPAASEAFFSKVQQCLPPLLALFLMNFIKVDGSPIFEWKDAVGSRQLEHTALHGQHHGPGRFHGQRGPGHHHLAELHLQPHLRECQPDHLHPGHPAVRDHPVQLLHRVCASVHSLRHRHAALPGHLRRSDKPRRHGLPGHRARQLRLVHRSLQPHLRHILRLRLGAPGRHDKVGLHNLHALRPHRHDGWTCNRQRVLI